MKLRMVAVGAAALVVGGVTAGIASPAYAQGEGADLAITIDGTTIAQGAGGKFGRVEVVNNGPERATGLLFTYDISELDTTRVVFALEECGTPVGDLIECTVEPDGLDKDGRITFFDPFEVVQDTPGPAGKITVSISHDGTDPDLDNNSMTADIVINEQGGVDLTVWALDISEEWVLDEAANEFHVAGDLLPGSETFAFVFIDNQGSQPTRGVEFSVTLPQHVTFTEEFPECTHEVGDSSTTCQVPSLALNPNVDDEFCHTPPPGEAGDGSCLFVFLPVKVADDAPESATLSGGVAEAWDMEVEFAPFTASALVHDPSEAPELPDVDPTDNTSVFSFFTSALDDSGTGGGGGGGDDDGGKLPVTGSPVMLITGLGAALLAAGAVLFLVTRRRRVKLTTTDT